MGHLRLKAFPGRIFKDQWWDEYDKRSVASGPPHAAAAYIWQAIGDEHQDELIAVILDADSGAAERRLADDIRNLTAPFTAWWDETLPDGTHALIGSMPVPS